MSIEDQIEGFDEYPEAYKFELEKRIERAKLFASLKDEERSWKNGTEVKYETRPALKGRIGPHIVRSWRDPAEYRHVDYICECKYAEDAELIARLLNEHLTR